MNKIVCLLIVSYLFINFSACKSDKKEESGTAQTAPGGSKANLNADPMMIPVPEGYYKPEGLKPLNLMEMYRYGSNNPVIVRNLPVKDKNGKDLPPGTMDNPERPLFMQMYANDSGRVVVGVAYEMTEEIKGMIMKVRMIK